jgi:hypothetical protein
VYYTTMGDERAQRETAKALERAAPFLRRHLGRRIRLRRVPEIEFFYDESIARGDRIEQILQELKAEAASRDSEGAAATEPREPSAAVSRASERVGGSGGTTPPALNDDDSGDED